MAADRPAHAVLSDHAELLEALAVPFGTYLGVATCRPVPGATTLDAILPDLFCALGKTEALTRRGRLDVALVEVWMRAHEVDRLFVVGADGLSADVWGSLCRLGDRADTQVCFVTSTPMCWSATVDVDVMSGSVLLAVNPTRLSVHPPLEAVLPDVGFPALLAACAEVLDGESAARAQAIYDDCLTAAFASLASDRMLTDDDAEEAFGMALTQVPNLDAVPLATHAVRAAGLLRGYHLVFDDGPDGVAFDALLTAERLAQLARLVSPGQAAAGILAGLPLPIPDSAMVFIDDTTVAVGDTTVVVPGPARPLLRAWAQRDADAAGLPASPSRPVDHRHRRLWRRPPPERLRARCQAIDCRPFRCVGDPPMGWARCRGG